MNVLFYLLAAGLCVYAGGRVYGRYVSHFLGFDSRRATPACEINDGRDFVPTKTHVLFAHHFSAIAGAGPIVGPTLALLYGFVPVWLWIVLGGVFIGAVHDVSTLFASVREGGRSIAEVAGRILGRPGFVLFILFTITMVVLVTSSFLSATAISLTSKWPLLKLGVTQEDTFLRTVVEDGVTKGVIGGIASTSVVIITLAAPLLGYLFYRRRVRMSIAYPLALAVMVASVAGGIYYPISLAPEVWMLVITCYVLVAAGVPVWAILQPRDFINVQILYVGIIALLVSLVIGGATNNLRIVAPSFNVAEGVQRLDLLWPMLFVTVACGAISGFHALVAGGTTAKQISSESDIRRIGFNAMLLESILAVAVVLAIASSLPFSDYRQIVWPSDPGTRSNPILAFSLAIGALMNGALHMPQVLGTVLGILLVEGFVITTLDAAVRINRYLFEELWKAVLPNPPAILRAFWFNAGVSALLMWVLAYYNAFNAIWPVFGAANQLLAALSLIAVAVWLLLAGKRAWFILLPAGFMVVTTVVALSLLLRRHLATRSYTLITADSLLLLLSGGFVLIAVRAFVRASRPGSPLAVC